MQEQNSAKVDVHGIPLAKMFFITSATEGEGGYAFTAFCLFVCLCAGHLKKLWTDPDEILWTGSVCDKEEQIRF